MRLWPLSRKSRPKQFLRLNGTRTVFQETLLRVVGQPFENVVVITNETYRFQALADMAAIEIAPAKLLLEAEGRNTAFALAAASRWVADAHPEALALALPSDHAIASADDFRAAAVAGVPASEAGRLVVFGIKPTFPSPDYGYIELGDVLDGLPAARKVRRFVEKPSVDQADTMFRSGNFLWNSGMFLFAPEAMRSELDRHARDILSYADAAVDGGYEDGPLFHLAARPNAQSPSVPIDKAIFEKTDISVCVSAEFGWSDIGDWAAVSARNPKDAQGNATSGPTVLQETSNSYIHSEGPVVGVNGVDNLLVVAKKSAVLVSRLDNTDGLRSLAKSVETKFATLEEEESEGHRPWGRYRVLARSERYKIKEIEIGVGHSISLQFHRYRSEHWVVVEGKARVTRQNEIFDLEKNQSVYIPKDSNHRLENIGEEPLRIVEVQVGDYVGEDDIVRIEDRYGRGDIRLPDE